MPPRRRQRQQYIAPTVEDCTRCNARTTRGTQCTRSTCKYADKCWQHSIAATGVEIKENPRNPAAGLGIWAKRDLRAGTRLRYGRFPRDVVEIDEVRDRDWPENRYLLCDDTERLCFDARSTQSGLGRWVNDVPRGQINSALRVHRPTEQANLVLTKNVRAGREIVTNYGPQYPRDWQPRRARR